VGGSSGFYFIVALSHFTPPILSFPHKGGRDVLSMFLTLLLIFSPNTIKKPRTSEVFLCFSGARTARPPAGQRPALRLSLHTSYTDIIFSMLFFAPMKTRTLVILLFLLLLAGCASTPPPTNVENICSIFDQYPDWYKDVKDSQSRWGVPIAVQMAIIYQESSFNATAKPPRKKLLWIIPWKRPSSAYGYSQALKNTWKDYEQKTGQSGSRTAFGDAADFIGWYNNQVCKRFNLHPHNAYALYLAYHEGPGGYAGRSYLRKPWLIRVSRKVAARAATYERQLQGCAGRL
jgi:hypothetical protein